SMSSFPCFPSFPWFHLFRLQRTKKINHGIHETHGIKRSKAPASSGAAISIHFARFHSNALCHSWTARAFPQPEGVAPCLPFRAFRLFRGSISSDFTERRRSTTEYTE